MKKRWYKKGLILGIIILFIGAAIIPNISGNLVKTSNQITNNNYVNAYWKLNEGSGDTAYDSSGHGYDGTIYGASWVTGYSSYALNFDGIDDYVNFDEHAKYFLGFNKSDDMIFSLYFKSTSTDKGIIYGQCRGDAYGYNPGVHIALNANGTLELKVWRLGCGLLVYTQNSFNDGNWHYVEARYNGVYSHDENCTGKIYVDGNLDGTSEYPVCAFYNDNFRYTKMGRHSYNSTDYFDGIIDEVKIIKYPGGNKQAPPYIDGPTYGETGEELNFTFTTYDPEEDELLEIEIDWGNGDIWELDGPYASGEEVVVSYAYDEKGSYNIKTRSKDIWDYSEWSEPYVIKIGNDPPNAPTISGPSSGRPEQSLWYEFNSVDPEDENVRFIIDWGDGNSDTTEYVPSGVDKTVNHIWDDTGTFIITASAEDTNGNISPSSTFTVVIPRDKTINNPFLNWLQCHPNLFLLLQKLINQLGFGL